MNSKILIKNKNWIWKLMLDIMVEISFFKKLIKNWFSNAECFFLDSQKFKKIKDKLNGKK